MDQHARPLQEVTPLADGSILNPALLKISSELGFMLEDEGEAFRFRYSGAGRAEIVKISTLSTDNQVRLSVLKHLPNKVHLKKMVFKSASKDPVFAGWSTVKTIDWTMDEDGPSEQVMASIKHAVASHLLLSGENARTPRTRFLFQDGTDKPVNAHVAGSFIIDKVSISSGRDMVIKVQNYQGCAVSLTPEQSAQFVSPMNLVGCRAIVHDKGIIRLLKEASFNSLYEPRSLS